MRNYEHPWKAEDPYLDMDYATRQLGFSNQIPLWKLQRMYESFDDIQLLLTEIKSNRSQTLLEVGCSTGELFRYVSNFCKHLGYTGIDISKNAIAFAREAYPRGKFSSCEMDMSDVIQILGERPEILICRDVLLHQVAPFSFLKKLIEIPSKSAVIRLRTRDVGETVTDPNISCQWDVGNRWIPYMVLNVDEMVDLIKETISFEKLIIVKNYIVLGGENKRYLTKDLYFPETGTAETSVFIEMGNGDSSRGDIDIEVRQKRKVRYTMFDRIRERVGRIWHYNLRLS